MRLVVRAALLSLATVGFVPRASAAPLQPTGKWVVNFAAAQCLASREFGTPDKPVTLAFKAPAAGNVIQIAVLRKGYPGGLSAEQVEATARFGSSPAIRKTALSYSPGKGKRSVVLMNLPRSEVAGWTGSQTLDLRANGYLNASFVVGKLAPMLKVIDDCVADLRSFWNYSEVNGPSILKQRASRKPAPLFTPDDYPGVAVWSGQEGTVRVVLLIDERGKVADCTLTETSGTAALDGQTCALISERASYVPAIGQDGKPAKDVLHSNITWRLE